MLLENVRQVFAFCIVLSFFGSARYVIVHTLQSLYYRSLITQWVEKVFNIKFLPLHFSDHNSCFVFPVQKAFEDSGSIFNILQSNVLKPCPLELRHHVI